MKTVLLMLLKKWATAEMIDKAIKAVVKSSKNPYDDNLYEAYRGLVELDADKVVKHVVLLIENIKAARADKKD